MKGFWEPNRFIALLSLSYLGAYGLEEIKRKTAVFLDLPFLFTPLLFALGTQLTSVDYPEDYFGVNAYLNEDGILMFCSFPGISTWTLGGLGTGGLLILLPYSLISL